MKTILLFSIVCYSAFAYGRVFFDKEGVDFLGGNDEWDDSVVIVGGQTTFHGYRVKLGITGFDDLPGGVFVSKKVKPFYLDEERLRGISYKSAIVSWRDKAQNERIAIAKRVDQVIKDLRSCNIDLRIDVDTFYAKFLDDIFYCLNSPLTSQTASLLYSGNYGDFTKVCNRFRDLTNSSKTALKIFESSAEHYISQYHKQIEQGGASQFFHKNYKKAFAIVSNSRGSGSAFVMNSRWKIYLYTNAHVVKSLGPNFLVEILDGSVLRVKENTDIHVAQGRDIVRIPFKKFRFCLKKSTSKFGVGDEVFIYGDSMGKGVVTVSEGKVIGVGPKMFEVDAPFVPGNSGSPVLNKYGRVIGIATAGALDRGRWETEGNRYSKNRYFVTSLDMIPWKKMTVKDFIKCHR